MAEDEGNKPEGQENAQNPNIASSSEEDAVTLDELTNLQEGDESNLGGQMQGRERGEGGVLNQEDMSYMASVHQGGFTTEAEVLDAIVPEQDDEFENDEEIAAGPEGNNDGDSFVGFEGRGERVRESGDLDDAQGLQINLLDDSEDENDEPAVVDEPLSDDAPEDDVFTVETEELAQTDSERAIQTDPERPVVEQPEDPIEQENRGPVGNDDTLSGAEDTLITFTAAELLANDTDLDGDSLSISSFDQPEHGEITYDAETGVYTFKPDDNWNGDTSFTYVVTDGNGASSTASVNITVDAVNDGPVGNNDELSGTEDKPITFTAADLLGNDTDVDGDTLSIASFEQPENGTITFDETTGEYTFTPDENWNGETDFTYVVSDGNGGSDTATVTIDVAGVNDGPVGNNDELSGTEDKPITFTAADLLGNDTDVDGDTLSIASFEQPDNGTITFNETTGEYTFTPDENWNGETDFTYVVSDGNGGSDTATVTIDVAGVNDGPVGNNDELSGTEDKPITFTAADLLGNDTDVDGDTLSIASFEQPDNGTITFNETTGEYTFTPDENWNGETDFTYVVSDGNGGSDTATVTIDVAGVNDGPVGNNDELSGTEDKPITFTAADLLGNDTDVDGDTLSIASFEQPENGTITFNETTGEYTFTPDENWNGETDFTYVVSDGNGGSDTATVTIDVAGVNDGPVGNNDELSGTEDKPITFTAADLLGNDTDVDGDTLSIASFEQPDNGTITFNETTGEYTFTPDENWNGETDFTYVVSDGNGGSDTATVTIDVAGVNDGPVGNNDELSGTEDKPITFTAADLLGNDTDVDGDTLSIASFEQPENGTITFNETTGEYTFTPDENWNGETDFTYVVSDGNGGSDTATVTIDVAGVNDGPVGNNDELSGTEDKPITFTAADLLGNDTDVDGDTLSIASFEQPENGTITFNETTGEYTFTPDENWNGETDFTYVVSDGNGGSDTATVTIDVAGVNDGPVGNNDELSGTEDKPITFTAADLLGNDTDVDGDTLSIASFEQPENGTITFNETTGEYTFTPDENWNGETDFTYVVSDGNGGSDTATVTIDVAGVNDGPVGNNDELSGTEDKPITFTTADLLGNDTDVDGDTLSITSFEQPENGTITFNETTGEYTFTPDENWNGETDFTYVVSDGNGGSDTATVTIDVAGVNDGPVGNNDELSGTEDKPITFTAADLLGNDTDVDGDTLSIASFEQPENGTITFNETTGEYTFTPDENWNGETDFTYVVSDGNGGSDTATVTIDVAGVNDGPVGNNDELSGTEDKPITFTAADLLGNDTDVDGDTLSIASFEQPENGTITFNETTGEYTFTPDENWNGETDFTYVVSDGNGGSDTATVTIDVAGVNDGPVGNNDELSGTEDKPITFTAADLLGNDTDVDGDTLSIASFEQPENGTITFDETTGEYTFTPDENWNGETDFTYVVSDGNGGSDTATVTIDVAGVNDGPVGNNDELSGTEDKPITFTAADLLGNDTDVDGDTLSIASFEQPENGTITFNETTGEYTFTPDENWNGETDFTYVVSDGNGGSDTATVTIDVAGVNDGPVGNNDELSGTEDKPITFTAADLLGNDTDVDGDTLSIASFEQPENGTITFNETTGEYTFTPDENWNGETDFTYVVSDGNGGSDTATVTIDVAGVNDGPVGNNDELSGTEDKPITFTAADLLGNDTDVDGDTLSIASFEQPENGTITFNETTGEYTFTPDENWNGETDFTYVVSDGNGGSDTATVTIDVAGVNDGPVGNNDELSGTEDKPITFTAADLLGNDTDVDGDTLSIASFEQPENGTITFNETTGEYTFTPDENWNGETDFTYVVSDGNGGSDTATVTIDVAGVNDGPVGNNDELSGTEDKPITFTAADLLGNDTDVDGDTLSIASFEQPENGTITFDETTGEYTFTPDENWNGETDFTYVVSDGNGGSDTATVTIDVAGVNDGPVGNNDELSGTEDKPITFTAADLLGNDTDVDGDTLSIASFEQPENGTITFNETTGEYTFTPDENWNGETDFTYVVSDGNGGSDTATVTIDVAGVNDGPVGNNDELSGTEDKPITFTAADLLGNDTDVDGDTLSIASFEQPENGTITFNETTGEYTFTPDENWNGETDFTYVVSDGNGGSDTATVTIDVAGVNDGPVGNNDELSGTEDKPITFTAADLLGNDTDVDGDTLSIASFEQPDNGTITFNETTGEYTFTPDENWNGETDFTYVVSDGNGGSDTATVTIDVAGVNDGPVGNNDELSGTEDKPITFTAADLLGNDTDVDGDTLSIASFEQPENGTITFNETTGEYTFTPDENWNGETDFTYVVSDGNGGSDTATVTIDVAGVNDGPVGNNDELSGTEDKPITFTAADLLGNDTDVDGDTLSIASFEQPENGTITFNETTGEYTFTPDENWNGETDFTYVVSDGNGGSDTATVTIDVAGVNDGPVGNNDELSGTEDKPITFTAADLLGNDTDVDGDTLSIASFEQPENGTITFNETTGEYTFTPDENWNGETDFTYVVSDGNGGSDTATVTIDVAGVNDGPVGNNDELSGTEDKPITFTAADLLGNDTDVDGDTLSIASFEQPENGTITFNETTGEYTFTPDENWNGETDFTYVVSDGNGGSDTATVTIDVAGVNDGPVGNNDELSGTEDKPITFTAADLLGNDTDVDGDTLSIASFEQPENGTITFNETTGEYTFTPDENWNGETDFTYVVSDGNGGSDTATVTIDVAGVNDGPVGNNDELSGTEDKPITFTAADLLGNDTDVDGDTLSIASFEQPENGTITFNETTGEYTFTPDENWNGETDFTYVVSDGNGGSDTATVTIDVAGVNDGPVGNNDELSGTEDKPITFTAADLLGNDTDVDGDTLSIASFEQPENGTITFNETTGEYTFTPDENWNGETDFTYVVSDGNGGSDTATVTIDVAGVNDGPVGNNDELSGTEDKPITFTAADLLGNDTDVDGDTLSIASFEQPENGTITFNETTGEYTFTPDENWNGETDFTYVVSDGNGGSDTATVTIDVAGVNDGPVGNNDELSGTEDKPITFTAADLLGNDTDVDGDTLSIASFEQPENGTITFNETTGEYTFTPDENWNGETDFTYVVSDGNGGSDTATVTIDVAGVNDGPVGNNDELSGTEDKPITFTAADLLGNDTDVDGDTLSIASFEQPENGTITFNETTGEYTFTPDENWNGETDFTYVVSDGNGGSDTATVTIDVAGVNDGPVGNNDELSGTEDKPITFTAADLLGNDTDVDGDTLSIASFEQPENGTITFNETTGEYTFTPDENWNGETDFTYVVSDGNGGSDTATVTIDVAGVNDGPVAGDDAFSGDEDEPITFTLNDLLGNDSDVESSDLSVAKVNGISIDEITEEGVDVGNGTLSFDSDTGTFTFDPTEDWSGTQNLTYTVSDDDGATAQANIALTVDGVADTPDLAVSVVENTAPDQSVTVTYEGSNAGYHNTYGYYILDENGEPSTGEIVFADLKDQSPGDTFTLDGVDPEKVGFFLISNGDNRNTGLEDGMDVTFEKDDDGNWQVVGPDGNELNHAYSGGVYFTDQQFNEDGMDHEKDDPSVNGNQNWEDQASKFAGNDFDFDDASFNVEWGDSEPKTVYDINISAAITDNDNSESLTVTIDNFPEGATFNLGEINEDGVLVISGDDLDDLEDLEMTVPGEAADFTLDVTATAEEPNGDKASTSLSVSPNFAPEAEDDTASVKETQSVTIDVLDNDSDLDNDSLSITEIDGKDVEAGDVVDVEHGSVTVNADGTLTFTADDGYEGPADFTYTVSDGNGGEDQATVNLTIEDGNVAPVANDDQATTTEDNAKVINLLGNDTDADNDALSITQINGQNVEAGDVVDVDNGTVTVNNDGTVKFTPDDNFNGETDFTYTVADDEGKSDTATVTVDVEAVNDGPVGNNDELSGTEDKPITFTAADLLGNDTDVDGDTLSIVSFEQPENGAITFNETTGEYTFTPDENWNGETDFTYVVSDGNGGSDTATVTIDVAGVNDGPEAGDDRTSTQEDQAVTFNPLANDTDVEDSSLNITQVDGKDIVAGETVAVDNGTVTLNDDGTVTFTPTTDYAGTPSFEYTVTDSDGATATATATVDVEAVADMPELTLEIGEPEVVSVDGSDGETNTITTSNMLDTNDGFTVTARVVDENGDLSDASADNVGSHQGGLSVNGQNNGPNGQIGFRETEDGGASEELIISFDNDVESASIDLLRLYPNENGYGGNEHGNYELYLDGVKVGEGSFVGDNPADGSHSFEIEGVTFDKLVISSNEDYSNGSTRDGDASDFVVTSIEYTEVDAEPQTFIEFPVELSAAQTDDDLSETLSAVTLSGIPEDAILLVDGEEYTVTDGSASIPTDKLDDVVVRVPEGHEDFNLSAEVTSSEGTSSETAQASAAVDVPSIDAGDDTATTDEDNSVTINLTANDSEGVTVTQIAGVDIEVNETVTVDNGTVTLNENGTVTFTPDENWNGETDFEYTVKDENGLTDTATATVTVDAVNDGPVGNNDELSGTEDKPITFTAADLLGNDTDVDGDTLSIASFEQPDNGTITFNETTGEYTFTPDENWNGETDFTYVVSDGNGGSDTATVTIDVAGVNDGPVGNNDELSGTEDKPITFTAADLLGNDTDVDGDTLSIASFEQPENGTITFNETTGEYTFTPDENWNGETDFTYVVSDGNGGSDTATVTIDVAGVNDGPVGNNDELSGTEDKPITFTAADLLGNDTDVDGDTLSIASFEQPENGTITFNETTGEYTFTPDENWNGETDFTYVVSDGNGGSDTATVTIDVAGVNDGPVGNNDELSGTEDKPITFTAADLLGNDTDVDGDTLSIASFEQPENGTITFNETTGEYTFTPDENWNGETDFTYVVSDGNGGSDTATVTIDVAGVNDGPVGNNDELSGTEDKPITFTAADLLGNDTDVDGDTLSIASFEQPENGTITFNETTGVYTFTPDENWNGETDFTYVVSDGNGGSDTATVTIDVAGVNDGPVIDQPIDVDTVEDNAKVIDLVANASDVDGDTLTVTEINGESFGADGKVEVDNGVVTLNDDGTVTFTPSDDYSGEATFEYTISDGQGGTATATATVDVEADADVPELTVTIGEGVDNTKPGETKDVTIEVDNVKSDGNGFTVTGRSINSDGTLSDESSDKVSINSSPEGFGVVGGASGANSEVGYNNTHNVSEQLVVEFDQDVSSVDVSFAWMHGGESAKVTFYKDGQPVGSTQINGGSDRVDPAVTLKPDNGSDFDEVVFEAPGGGDDFLVHSIDFELSEPGESTTTYPLNIDAGLTDTDGSEKLSIEVDGLPDGAVLSAGTKNADGSWTLDADDLDGLTVTVPADSGEFKIEVEATATETSNGDSETIKASVDVDVNDAPTANDDVLETNEDEPLVFNANELLANDTDPDGDALSVVSFEQPENGALTFDQATGEFTFTPDKDFSGDVSFNYTVSDGNGETATATATIEVDAVADAPEISLGIGTPSNVTLGGSEGSTSTVFTTTFGNTSQGFYDNAVDGWETTADAIEVWKDGGKYDGEGSFVELNDDRIDEFDDATGISREINTVDGAEYTINFDYSGRPGFDEDVNKVQVRVNGEVVHTFEHDNSDGSQTDWQEGSFTFEGDGEPMTIEFVSIGDAQDNGRGMFLDNIEAIETTPDEPGDVYTDYPINLSVSETDTNGPDETLSDVTLSGLPGNAIVLVDGEEVTVSGNSVQIAPDNLDDIVVRVPEGSGPLDIQASVTSTDGDDTSAPSIATAKSNVGPEANDDTIAATEDTAQTFDLVANDTDADNDDLSVTEINGVEVSAGDQVTLDNGTLTINNDGSITFMPSKDFSGDVSFDYTVSDGNGGSDTATATIDVDGVADGAEVALDVTGGTETTIGSGGSGDTYTINYQNFEDLDGVSVRGSDEGTESSDNILGGIHHGDTWMGVERHGGYSALEKNEKFVFEFENDVDTADINFQWMEGRDEANYTLYKDGQVVGSGTLDGDGVVGGPNTPDFDKLEIGSEDGSFWLGDVQVTESASAQSAMEYDINLDVSMNDASESLNGGVIVDLSDVPNGSELTIGDATVKIDSNGNITVTGDDVSVNGTNMTVPSSTLDSDLNVTGTIKVPLDANGDHGAFDLTASVSTVDGDDTSSVSTGTDSIAAHDGETQPVDSGQDAINEGIAAEDREYTSLDDAIDSLGSHKSAEGTSGNDTIRNAHHNQNANGGREFIDGGAGDDNIGYEWDSKGDDVLVGGTGDDTVQGGKKDDILYGDDGDNLDASTENNVDGDDRLRGGQGNDQLYGEGGNDSLDGGQGNDFIVGGSGNDVIHDTSGKNTIHGGSGDDTITTGWENNTIHGGSGDDVINAQGGNNTIDGGTGDDTIDAGSGNDVIDGGDGNNTISSDSGNDTITTGSGDDDIDAGYGNDVINAGDGNNTITSSGGNNEIETGDGNDSITTSWGNDSISSGDGNDVITDQGGNNFFDAGAGNDTITGGSGKDTFIGGAGDDTMIGGGGDDLFVFGGADDQSVSGNDWIEGGDWGNDVIQLNGDEGWTMTINNDDGSQNVISSQDAMNDYQDVSGLTGQIEFEDGSTVIFEGVEKVEW